MQKEVVQEEGDKRMVREVFAGRTVSKPTRPNPVYTPRRKKAEASTMTNQQKDSESEIESDIDEVTVVMKAGGKKRMKLKLPGGELQIDFKMQPN